MRQLPTPDTRSSYSQGHTGTGEQTTRPANPSCQIGGKLGVLLRGKLVGPEILATYEGQGEDWRQGTGGCLPAFG